MTSSTPQKFHQLTAPQRLEWIQENWGVDHSSLEAYQPGSGLSLELADHMIENVAGIYALPVGIAQHFIVNGQPVLIPMVIEEPSVVAGASYMAKLAQATGGFTASADAPEMIGQIQILDITDLDAARERILSRKAELLEEAARYDPVLISRGGGPRDLEVRIIENSPIGPFLVVHLICDVRDAMGANAVNTTLERLAPRVQSFSGGRVHLRILSNLADRRLARAQVTIRLDQLAFGQFSGEEVREGIIAAWAFAAADPYRAATHNKGIMNGVDAVVVATGNDWRAIEAGAHAYAARSGRYTSLTTWGKDPGGNLTGFLEMPMAVGIIGGATRVHPGAQTALKIMGVESAAELAEIIVSVGLAQNLAALRALATEGIQRGHMTLHARQIAIAAGAAGDQITVITNRMVEEQNIRLERAIEILNEVINHGGTETTL